MNQRVILFFLFIQSLLLQLNLDPALADPEYTVKKGDTLYTLALKHNTSVDNLIKLNNLSSNNLQIGQKLIISSESGEKNGKGITYKVVNGDTLSEIADRYGMSSRDLVKANNLPNAKLSIGQEIHIPGPGTAIANSGSDDATVSNSVTDPKNHPHSYEVASGDTLSKIAEKFGVTTTSLKEANNISSSMIRKGQKLLIPGKIDKKKNIAATVSSDTTRERNVIASKNQDLEDYTVRQGDTLSEIAERFGTSSDNLIFVNDITGTQLIAGRTIRVPSAGSAGKTRSAEESFSYKIQKGDTLYSLARKYDTKVELIKDINGLSSNNLRTGETIVIPGDGYVKSSPEPAGEPVVYKIRKGDTLGRIAQKFGVSVQSIRRANNINGNIIRAGSTMLIPSTETRTIDYRVQKGDSLSYIARTHGSRVDLIKKANRLNSNSIYAGQILSLPVVRPGSASEGYIAKSYKDPGKGMYDSNIKSKIINVAKKYLGAPYKFGGTSERTGIDCSAYVNKVFRSFNVQLPRTARDIYKEGEWVEKDDLQKGDLVFFTTYAKFPSHVGIYMGNNKFIHASSASKKVTITDITRRYYKKRYIGAKRIPVEGLFYEQYSREFDDTGNNYN